MCLYHRMFFNCEYLLIANCKLRVFPTFTSNRFASINIHIYCTTVLGQPSQFLDLQFGLTCLKHSIKLHN